MEDLRAGQKVYDFTNDTESIGAACIEIGNTTGSSHACRLEGCSGLRIGVKWKDGKMTFPCSKGMYYRSTAFHTTSIHIDADSWLIEKHPLDGGEVEEPEEPEIDWKAISAASPRESDGETPMQMPGNWSVDDVTQCMASEMAMSSSEILELVKDRDLMYEILTQFQENLATHEWTDDMEDAIEHCLKEHRS